MNGQLRFGLGARGLQREKVGMHPYSRGHRVTQKVWSGCNPGTLDRSNPQPEPRPWRGPVSERNTALFVLAHLSDEDLCNAFQAWPDYDPAHFAGEEGPRVGRGEWHGQPFTHVALRLFEVAGIRLMDEDELPDNSDLEMVLGRSLSMHAPVVFGLYEDEEMAGGGARFEGGELVYRVCIDGRLVKPARRGLSETKEIPDLDTSHWIWPHATKALREAFGDGFESPPGNDDELEEMIDAADAGPLSLADTPPIAQPTSAKAPASNPTATAAPRKRDRLRSRIRSLFGR